MSLPKIDSLMLNTLRDQSLGSSKRCDANRFNVLVESTPNPKLISNVHLSNHNKGDDDSMVASKLSNQSSFLAHRSSSYLNLGENFPKKDQVNEIGKNDFLEETKELNEKANNCQTNKNENKKKSKRRVRK